MKRGEQNETIEQIYNLFYTILGNSNNNNKQ